MGEGEDAAPEADRPGTTFEIQWEFASRQIAKELPTQDTRTCRAPVGCSMGRVGQTRQRSDDRRPEEPLPCGASNRRPKQTRSGRVRPSHPLRPRSPHHDAPAGCERVEKGHLVEFWSGQALSAGTARERPGSYSWPALRREADQRFAAGHDPQLVIQETVTRIVPRRHHRPARCDGGTHTHRGFCPRPPPQANPDANDARYRQVRTHPARVDATPPMGRHRPALARRPPD